MWVMATIFVRGAQRLLEGLERQVALLVDVDPLQHRPAPLAQEVPGHDVGVVLHDGEHDLVALVEALAECRGDQVDRLGRRFGEDDLVRRARVEEAAHQFARAFIRIGRSIGEVMQPAMHVGIFAVGHLRHAVDHGPRLLRRGRIVQIDERLAVDLQVENREVRADAVDVVGDVGADMRVHGELRPASQRVISARKRVVRSGSPIASATSPANPSSSSASARGRGRPRVWR